MYAYCGNNPINLIDSTGQIACGLADPHMKCADNTYGGGASAGGIVVVGGIIAGFDILLKLGAVLASNRTEVYAFAKAFLDSLAGRYANHQPRVHHVVPVGLFSRYGQKTMAQLIYMHDLLKSAKISINDPENLLILSQGTHKSMHTPEYIESIYNIMKLSEYGNEISIRIQLFFARQYAASLDQYPNGY